MTIVAVRYAKKLVWWIAQNDFHWCVVFSFGNPFPLRYCRTARHCDWKDTGKAGFIHLAATFAVTAQSTQSVWHGYPFGIAMTLWKGHVKRMPDAFFEAMECHGWNLGGLEEATKGRSRWCRLRHRNRTRLSGHWSGAWPRQTSAVCWLKPVPTLSLFNRVLTYLNIS